MKIAFDLRNINLGASGGISQLLQSLLRCLVHRHDRDQYVFFATVFNRGLLTPLPEHVEVVTLVASNYLQQIGPLCKAKEVDVLFRGYPMEETVDFPWTRQIVEIPDIQHEYFPEFFTEECLRARRAAFRQTLGSAGAIGTISEFARQSLWQQECRRCQDIFLICPALQPEHRAAASEPLTADERAALPTGDYFVFPANLWQHKNHRRLFTAFTKFLTRNGKTFELICTGHPDGWEAFAADTAHLPVRHLGFVRPPMLRKLLEGACALTFFSLHEGFGMPLLEAFDAGTPVLCSNTTSLPEVGQDAVLTCDPTDEEAMARLMATIADDAELRQTLIARGRQRLGAYTWEEAADNLHAACARVVERHQPLTTAASTALAVQDWPTVSIVTPSFNQGRFLKRTIDSVLTQGYPHTQYLVMDGGSTDESVAIMQSYGDRLAWVSEKDNGQTEAINKGFARCDGHILAYLNSDDTLLPGAVEKVVHHFTRQPSCDLVYGEAHYIDEDDQITGKYSTADYTFDRLMQDCCICQPAAFWRAGIAEKVGPFDESLHFAMDYDYWIRVDRAGGRIEHVSDFLACSRLYAETKTLACRTKVFDEIIRVCKKNAGYASLNYYIGLWHHICYERGTWRRPFCRLPLFPNVMARLHHYWMHRGKVSAKQVFNEIRGTLKTEALKFKPILMVAKPMKRFLTAARSRRLLAIVETGKVTGFWADNWLAPKLKVRLRDSTFGREVSMTGTAPQPLTLTVSCNQQQLGVFDVPANEMTELTFHVEAGQGRELVLDFSKHYVDPSGRQIAFLLHGTDLFTEQDLVA